MYACTRSESERPGDFIADCVGVDVEGVRGRAGLSGMSEEEKETTRFLLMFVRKRVSVCLGSNQKVVA